MAIFGTLHELLTAAGAVRMNTDEDGQALYDFVVSKRHRVYVAFDSVLKDARMATVSLITRDGSIRVEQENVSGIDIHRIGQWSVHDIADILREHGSFTSKILPFKHMLD